jgi:hypothetical protein
MRETGTGQQVAQLHDRYMMMMMMNYSLTTTQHHNRSDDSLQMNSWTFISVMSHSTEYP